MQKIPLVDVHSEYAPLIPRLEARFREILDSGQTIRGPHYWAFQEEAAAYLGVEREHERVGAVGDADRALHPETGGRLLLERPVVRPANEPAAVEHLAEAGLELRDQLRVLGVDVNERNRLHGGQL